MENMHTYMNFVNIEKDNGKQHLNDGISIIIPTKNNISTIEILLNSIKKIEMKELEIIVVDTNSNDGTKEICKRYECKIIESNFGRSKSRNMGAIAAKYDKLLFLDSDMEVTQGVLYSISNSNICDALIFKEETIGNSFMSKIRKFERDGIFGTIYPEAPRFIKKEIFFKIGGYNEEMEGFEDLDLHNRLIREGFRIDWCESLIFHHEENMNFIMYLKKKKFYLLYFNEFRESNQKYYQELKSIRLRTKILYKSIKSSKLSKSFVLFPMVILLRLIEVI